MTGIAPKDEKFAEAVLGYDPGIITEGLRCKCSLWPNDPCESEFDGLDELCTECRPRCPFARVLGHTLPNGWSYGCSFCACKLIPLIGAGKKTHVNKLSEPH